MKPLEYAWLYKRWDQLRSSYWFLPTLIVMFAILLAWGLIIADHHYRFDLVADSSWLFLGRAESARVILSTIATSMITIVSLTFSMTIVVLTLAGSQFGSRLIYNFMRDRNSQVALGIFLACFVFCLLILRSVQSNASGDFIPHLGVTAALLFAVLSIGVLIFYIHHVADSIHANRVIANVRHELELIVQRLIPDGSATPSSDAAEWQHLMALADAGSMPVAAHDRGILQAIEEAELLDWAAAHDLLIRLQHRPGEFVLRDNPLFEVYPRERVPSDQLPRLQEAFRFGHKRTLVQDIEFSFQQLVEIAVRALSPGINDPFTAMSCVDELGSGLALIGRRGSQPRILRDVKGKPRILVKAVDFAGLADIAFNQIRQSGPGHTAVMIRLLEVIAAVASTLSDRQQLKVLRQHAEAAHAVATENAGHAYDRADIDARFQCAMRLLEERDE